MRALGLEVKKADVLKLLKDYDRDNTGKMLFANFNEIGEELYRVKLSVLWLGYGLTLWPWWAVVAPYGVMEVWSW